VALYGNAVIVNTEFAAANPEAVTGALRAIARGVADAAADPAAGAAAVIARNPAGDVELETRRLQLALDANILTPWVMENGMGGIDMDRMATAIEQLRLTYEFQNEPDVSLYFTDAFLPEAEVRMVAPQ
jgi:NitT/TauT family transport system substrate-binding protein